MQDGALRRELAPIIRAAIAIIMSDAHLHCASAITYFPAWRRA
jgi:hypothetical protein